MTFVVLIFLMLAFSLLAMGAYRPEWLTKAAYWLAAAGVVILGWINQDVITGMFQ